jgi:hypothetical protein
MKKLTYRSIFATFIFLALLFSMLVIKVPVRAASIIIAASNSSSAWKSEATATCSGSNDQNTINNYLTNGNTVELAPGTFNCNGLINVKTGDTLYGQGNSTVLNLQNNNGYIYMGGASDVTVGNLELAGNEYVSSGLIIGLAGSSAVSGFDIHDITDIAVGGDDFVVYANNGSVSNIAFVRCDASNPDGYGFLVNGAGAPSSVQNITFFKDTVENAGAASTRTGPWITAFDMAEYAGLTVNQLQAIDCTVNGAWESDFHSEIYPTKTNWVITNCTANDAGLKTGGAFYGAGYLIPFINNDSIVLNDNTASGIEPSEMSWGVTPDLAIWNVSEGEYVCYAPPQNMIIPANSGEIATPISQGNCTGLMVTNGNDKNLYLFSSDGNSVNQQIALGGYYASNDGNTYSFNGQSIVVQFNDYAVIRLVQTSSSTSSDTTTSSSTTSGTLSFNPIGNQTVAAGNALKIALSATDAPGMTLQYSANNMPAGASLQSDNIFRWTPTTSQEGTYSDIYFQVSDGTSIASQDITITVTGGTGGTSSQTQTLAFNPIGNQTVAAGNALKIALSATDAPGMTLQYSANNMPAGASLQSDNIFRWTPTASQVGTYSNIYFQVSDGTSIASQDITITVTN